MSGAGDLEARLRGIVTAHVVVGGYPDTMGIARAAYALARANMARDGVMHMERTVWRGSTRETQRRDMEAWIETAGHEALGTLCDDAVDGASDEAQRALALAWTGSCAANGQPIDDEAQATYHWGEGERVALRRAVARLRPDLSEPDPGQGSLL